MEKAEFERRLEQVLTREIDGCSALVSVERLSGGASQETYRLTALVNGAEQLLAMRRSPGGEFLEPLPTRPGIAVEALLLKCARDAGVPAPEVYYVLTREDDLGDAVIMEWLEGEALGARIVRSDQFAEIRPRLAYECGQILAKIHSINLPQAGLDKVLSEVSPDAFIDQMWDRYKLLETPQPMIDYAARWLKENLPTDFELALVHNDFRCGNFMITSEKITAILDWETAHIGDPMRDLAWMCCNSWRFGSDLPVGGFGSYEDMFRGYEDESGKKVDPNHVKFWEVFGSFWWAVGTLGFVEQYRVGPDQTVERPAIGRRTSECQIDCVNLLIPGAVDLVAEASADSSLGMPRADELLISVRDFLRVDVMGESSGRTNFLARVASNSVDIVIRELALGPAHREGELSRLQEFYNSSEGLEDLRWNLIHKLRDGNQSLDDDALKFHLRTTVANQVAIDQPKYTGLRTAITAK